MSKNNIILVGFMGAGKSTVATELVKCSGFSLLDLDSEIEMKEGKSIQQIFSQGGESAFRDLESAALRRLRDQEGLVVATGGGILCRQENRDLIKKLGYVIYLRASFSALKRRLSRSTHRPLVKAEPDWQTLEKLLLDRTPFYETAEFIVETDNKEPAEIAKEILQRIAEA